MNLTDLHKKPLASSRLLKTDFSEEERAWRECLPAFVQDIAVANVECEPCMAPEDDQKIVQNTEQKPKEQRAPIVESVNVGERHSEPANDTMQPKEQCLSNDPFGNDAKSLTMPSAFDPDDIFGFEEPAKKTETPPPTPASTPKTEQKKETMPASGNSAVVGVVGFENPHGIPGIPLPSLPVEPPKASPGASSPPAGSAPNTMPETEDAESNGSGDYAEMMQVVGAILEKTSEVDILSLLGSIEQYTVQISLDAWREDATILAKRGAEIASKMDSLHALLLQVRPTAGAMDDVVKWLEDVGVNCFEGSSEKKRQAKMKLATKDFWIRHARLKRASKELKETYDHLNRQWDTISRLISVDQDRNRRKEFGRGAAPWEDAAVAQQGTEELNRSMSQPLKPSKFSDLDGFPQNPPKIQPANAKKHLKGEIDF